MKLCFIAHRINNPITGGEYYNEALLVGARKAGYEVVKLEGIKWDCIKNRVLRIIFLNVFFLFKTMFLSKNDLLVLDTDFHARIIFPLLWGRYISRVKIVGMLHLYCYLLNKGKFINKYYFFLERFMSRKCDYIIVNSRFSYKSFQDLTGKSIPYTVLTPFSKEASDQKYPRVIYDEKLMKIIQVGTIEHRKNVYNTIQAVSMLKTPFLLMFVGHCYSSVYYETLSSLIKSKQLDKKVIFKGNVNRPTLHKYFLESTIFILVSRMESYGMVYAEAMQYGLPIVGSTTGSVPELVKDGENGYLCDPENPEKIAEAIEKLHDRNEWERVSMNNYSNASKLMDKDTFIKQSRVLFSNL